MSSIQNVHHRAFDSAVKGFNSSATNHDADPGSSLPSEPSALVTVIGGNAFATGAHADATGAVSNNVDDLGNATVASGFAVFEATGTSSHGRAKAIRDC